MTGIVALAVLAAVGIVGLVVAVRFTHRCGEPTQRGLVVPATQRALDRELTSMLDRATVELLGARLAAGAILVPVRMGHRLLGPYLLVDVGTSCLRLQLYREHRRPPSPAGRPADLARLRAVAYRDGQGWWFVFDGPVGPQQYLGWLVETVERRLPVGV